MQIRKLAPKVTETTPYISLLNKIKNKRQDLQKGLSTESMDQTTVNDLMLLLDTLLHDMQAFHLNNKTTDAIAYHEFEARFTAITDIENENIKNREAQRRAEAEAEEARVKAEEEKLKEEQRVQSEKESAKAGVEPTVPAAVASEKSAEPKKESAKPALENLELPESTAPKLTVVEKTRPQQTGKRLPERKRRQREEVAQPNKPAAAAVVSEVGVENKSAAVAAELPKATNVNVESAPVPAPVVSDIVDTKPSEPTPPPVVSEVSNPEPVVVVPAAAPSVPSPPPAPVLPMKPAAAVFFKPVVSDNREAYIRDLSNILQALKGDAHFWRVVTNATRDEKINFVDDLIKSLQANKQHNFMTILRDLASKHNFETVVLANENIWGRESYVKPILVKMIGADNLALLIEESKVMRRHAQP